MKDLTQSTRVFEVPTVRVRDGYRYMGENVRVNARDAEHAKQVVRQNGYEVNRHFEPTEIRSRPERRR